MGETEKIRLSSSNYKIELFLRSIGGATALALAGVLSLAGVGIGLAAALSLTGILSLAGMSALVGEGADLDAGLRVIRSVGRGGGSEESGDGGCGEGVFGREFHDVCFFH